MLLLHSGVREDADGSVTYCLVGNGLSIVANEEYLTISSTLEPQHPTVGLPAPRALAGPASRPGPAPSAHPERPLTTQPPKGTHRLAHQGPHPGHCRARPPAPPPPPPSPPPPPITTQVISSAAPCAPTLPGEDVEERGRRRQDEDDQEDMDEEEEESRRKASVSPFGIPRLLEAGIQASRP